MPKQVVGPVLTSDDKETVTSQINTEGEEFWDRMEISRTLGHHFASLTENGP